jgi:hypothetical protein
METKPKRKRPLNNLSNLYEKQLQPGRIGVYTFTNNYKLGEVDITTSTFHCVPRTSKNIFRNYTGLGLNAELLSTYRFEFIEIPFEGKTLKTTREKWLKAGIPSSYSNSNVDQQIILPISKINFDEVAEKVEVEQYEIF